MRLIFPALLLVLTLVSPLLTQAKDKSVTVKFQAQNNSGETGTATLTPDGDATMVTIKLAGAPADAQPAHVHVGPCAKLDPKPSYPLQNVTGGKSTTKLDVPISKLMSGEYAINVHKSTSDISTYVACADLKSVASSNASNGTNDSNYGGPSNVPGKAY
ncbi:MAG: hypothetical protein ACREM8_02220 [Vulcanimicrobiaceae bacterium]